MTLRKAHIWAGWTGWIFTAGFLIACMPLTGIHLTHLLAGMCVLVFLYRMSKKVNRETKDIRAMESGASFWHVVDLLWIVLFPLLYLAS